MKKQIIFLIVFAFHLTTLAQQSYMKAYVTLNPIGDFVADFTVKKGTALVDKDSYVAKDVEIDMTSIKTKLETRDEHAKNKYMDVKKYPTALLLEAQGKSGQGKGKIKYRDKTVDVTGTYTIVDSGKTLKANFVVKASSFGIADINYKGVGVEDDIKVEVAIPVVRK